MRYLTVLTLVTSGLVVPVRPAAPAAAQPATASCPTAATDRVTAASTAMRCRRQIEDVSARSEREQVFANPDGTMTSVVSAVTQRVRRNGGWVAPDPTLRAAGDRIVPAATAMDMSFSGGGDTPLITVRAASGELSLRWPGRLPTPVVAGAQVTYPSVLPDVDLVVTAEVEGFSKVLVVKTAAAAANPALTEVRFVVEAKGLAVRSGESGSLRVVDGAGTQVMASGAPTMWDSSGSGPEGRSTATDAGTGARDATMPVRVSGSDLLVRPDRGFLTAKTTKYPVYVDPSLVASAWTMINNRFPDQSYWSYDKYDCPSKYPRSLQCAKVGFTDDPSPSMTYRSLFQFPAGDYVGKHVLDAQLSMDLLHSWITDNTRTDVHVVGNGLHSETDWYNNAGSWAGSPAASGWSATKNQGRVRAEWGLTAVAQTAAAQWWGSTTLGLKAGNENNHNAWKKFDATTARFTVTYNSYPNAPDQLSIGGAACATGAARPYVRTLTPELRARVTDPDGLARSLAATFAWWPVGGSPNTTNTVTQTNVASGAQAVTAVPAGRLADGGTYAVRVNASDGIDTGQFSATCEFAVDVTPPATPSAVTSSTYPSNGQLSGGAGIEGTFTFSPPASGAADVVGYAYTVDTGLQPAQATQVTAAVDRSAQVVVTPPTDGVQTLRVWSRDIAGNFSTTPRTYVFGVRAGAGPDALWRFEEPSGNSGADSSQHGNTLTLVDPARTTGRGGQGTAVVLNGTAAHGRTGGPLSTKDPNTDQPVTVRTDANFTVSAWVRLDAVGTGQHTVVSQDGIRTSGFQVGYSGPDNRWRFSMTNADVDDPAIFKVHSDAAPTPGRWTHLTAVYDSATHLMRLYVDGTAQTQTATVVGGFNATGPVVVGRRLWAGNADGWFAGAVDDIRVYRRALSTSENEFVNALKPVMPKIALPDGNRTYPGRALRVTLDANGDTSVTSIRYGLASAGTLTTVALPTPGGKTTVTVTPTVPGGTFVVASGVTATGRESDRASAVVSVVEPPALTGIVVDGWTGAPVAGATVRLQPPGTTVTTGPDGSYSFTGLDAGQYTVSAASTGQCGQFATTRVNIDTLTYMNLTLLSQAERFGYTCSVEARAFVPADQTVLPLTGDDAELLVDLPFPVPYYGEPATTMMVSTNGLMSSQNCCVSSAYSRSLPGSGSPDGVIAPYWDELVIDAQASVRTAVVGTAPNRQFVIEWRNAALYTDSTVRVTFEVLLGEDGTIVFNYAGLDSDRERGTGAAVGIESRGGRYGLQYSHQLPILTNGHAVVFAYPAEPRPINRYSLTGRVTRGGEIIDRGKIELYPVQRSTGPGGAFSFTGLEEGAYTLRAKSGCEEAITVVDLQSDVDLDVPLGQDRDAFGHTCTASTMPFVRADQTVLPMPLNQSIYTVPVSFPFPFTYYGQTYTTATVAAGAALRFGGSGGSMQLHHALTVVRADSSVRTAVLGTAPNRQFVIEWRNVATMVRDYRTSFEVILNENGTFTFAYADIDPTGMWEDRALRIGISGAGTSLLYMESDQREPLLVSNRAVTFTPPTP